MANWGANAVVESYAYDNSTLIVAANTASFTFENRATISSNVLKIETVSRNIRPTVGQLFPR